MSTNLGDHVSLCRGTTYKSLLLDEPGPMLLGLGSIQRNGGFKGDGLRTYGGDSPAKVLIYPGDIYVSLKDVTHSADLLGAVACVPEQIECGRLTQDTVKLEFDGLPIDRRYVYWALRTPQYRSYCRERATGTTNLGLSRADFFAFGLPAPTKERLALVELLDSIDDKVAANRRLAETADELAETIFRNAVAGDGPDHELREVAGLITRGVAPKYTDDETELTVLNQKCIRSKRIDLTPARRTLSAKVADTKRLCINDVLVNSTGAGTLGRVARWVLGIEATVDSHVSIVRFDPTRVDEVCAGFAVLHMQEVIEMMGEGSTGQTELSRDQLGKLRLRFIAREREPHVSAQLQSLSSASIVHLAENEKLATLRDTLLPRLMSGELRVKDAERLAEAVL
ncbi:restriction endonuclease subunit S [Rhodococcus sp. D2-41]|uniref:Restriction endonuclease subunit S n=1 Tax=Speluncibacter jeojiensis TaxID=2710754 RepID=A0A9X4M1M4_9ACTN|nr:restriction endonuclease subunit S [Rhodococcus sp. D2-41]MDG3012272.1 restriction endonuclease subunit S [Rhodococcus sp. D2-41]MDG3014757.1 restriction endonuclease subunit S [Corynebacteriales bacterium D3-21]